MGLSHIVSGHHAAQDPKVQGREGERKKWNKGKARDKLQSQVLFDKSSYEKFQKETPTYKLTTTAVLSDRLKIKGSLARKAIALMEKEGKIQKVSTHHMCSIYT